MLLFGTNGIVASHILLTSTEIVLLRTFIGSLFLFILLFIGSRQFSYGQHKRDTLFVLLSGAAMGTSWMFLYEAYVQVGVGIATLLYNIGPILVILLSRALFGEKLTVNKGIGAMLAVAGMFLINGGAVDRLSSFGLLCGILSACTYAVMVTANKKAAAISGLENTLLQLATAFVTTALYIAARGIVLSENSIGHIFSLTWQGWLWVLLLGIINTGVGCYLYFSSIGGLPAQTVAICGYLESVSAVLFSALFLSERMTPLQLCGGILIIGGALLCEWRKKSVKS